MEGLTRSHALLRQENQALRRNAEVGEERIRSLEDDLQDAKQRRQSALARLDVLISELDELEARLDRSTESRRSESAGRQSSAGHTGG